MWKLILSFKFKVTLDYNDISNLKKEVDFKAQQCELLNAKLKEKLNLISQLEAELESVNKSKISY